MIRSVWRQFDAITRGLARRLAGSINPALRCASCWLLFLAIMVELAHADPRLGYASDWGCGWNMGIYPFNSSYESCSCALAVRNAAIPNDPVQGPASGGIGPGTGNCYGTDGRHFAYWQSAYINNEKGHGKPRDCNVSRGNPCNAATGNKYQTEEDLAATNQLPAFVRHYNSQLDNSKINTMFNIGHGWTSTFNKYLGVYGSLVQIRQTDGRSESFTCLNGICTGDTDTYLALTHDASGYVLTLRSGSKERYDTTGKLRSETSSAGQTTNYGYNSAGRISTATDSFGHSLTIGYNASGHVWTITDLSNRVIEYLYDTGKQDNNLRQVNYPDGTAKIYHYEDTRFPSHLTGISYVDAQGATTRYATYAYDATGKAVRTEHAPTDNGSAQERFTLNYDSDTQTTVTDPVAMQEVMTFETNLGVKNLVSKVNQSDSKSVRQVFDGNNNLACRKDEENRVTLYSYNSTNQKLSQTEGLLGTDCNACLSDPASCNAGGLARTTTFEYLSPTLDLPRFLRRPSVAAGQTFETELVYGDTAHPNLPTQIIQRGHTPSGTAVSRAVTLGYNASGQVNAINGPRTDVNDVTTLEYYECTTGGACGQLKKITNALGHVTTYDQYDANGRLKQMTDPNGLITTYTYDPRGRVKTITRTPPLGGGSTRLTTFTYTPWGAIQTATTPDGVTLTYGYDAAQHLRSITDNLGNRVEYHYDLKGNRDGENTFDPNGTLVRSLAYESDLRNRLKTLDAAGSITQRVFDAVGNLVSETDPNNNPSTLHTPDALNRLIQTLDRLDGITDYGYDANDRLTQVTAPGNPGNRATTAYQYDDLGNLLKEISPDRGTTSYTHDAAGNVTGTTDARGIAAGYGYDALNRLTAIDYPGTGEDVSFAYDTGAGCAFGVGRVCRTADESGITAFAYDGFGNVVQITRLDDEAGSVTFENLDTPPLYFKASVSYRVYAPGDAASPLPSDTDYTLVYVLVNEDSAPPPGQFRIPLDRLEIALPPGATLSRAGHAGTGVAPSGIDTSVPTMVRFQFLDPYLLPGQSSNQLIIHLPVAPQPVAATVGFGGSVDDQRLHAGAPPPVVTRYVYDPADRLLSVTLPDARVVDLGRDARGRLAGVTATVNGVTAPIVSNRTYRADGLLSGQRFGNGLPETRVHDLQGRLVRLTLGAEESRDYVLYDANGNLKALAASAFGASYGYDALDRLTSEAGPGGDRAFGYDGNGNRVSDGANTYTIAPDGNRVQMVNGNALVYDPAGHLLDDGQGRTFTYNAAGRLKEVWRDSVRVAAYTYDVRGLRTRRLTPQGATFYYYDPSGHPWLETDIAGAPQRVYLWADDTPVAQLDVSPAGDRVVYLHTDHLDTPRLATDAEKNIVWRWEGGAFGGSLPAEDVDGDGNKTIINLRFAGQYYDSETGLHYNWHRYYDPKTGRYLTSDPIGLAGGLNTYAYVENNPLRFIDPSGLIEWTGSVTGGTLLTFGYFQFDLASDCVNGKRARVKVVATGPGLGFGLDVSGTTGTVKFRDPFTFINPDVFNAGFGDFFLASAGASIPPTAQQKLGQTLVGVNNAPHGVAASAIRIGDAGSVGAGPIRGLNVGVGFVTGTATVIEQTTEDCSCK